MITFNFGLQMKNYHLATLNLFMVKTFYLTITTFLECVFYGYIKIINF